MMFTPTKINQLEIKNRLVRSGTGERLATDQGSITKELIDFYADLACKDIGLIITGHAYVQKNGKCGYRMAAIDKDQTIAGWKKVAKAVHETDSKIFIQLDHGGGQIAEDIMEEQTVAPSPVKNYNYGAMPRQLSHEEIEELVSAFIKAAVRGAKAGFDGVQFLAAQGYLINQFMSPYFNKRTDKWGGPLENRFRFLKEIYQGARQELGKEYPLTAKFCLADITEGGLKPSEGLKMAKELDKAGLDAFEVSGGASIQALNSVRYVKNEKDEAYYLPHLKRMRRHVKANLMLVGGIQSRSVMENLLKQGADMVSMCRPFVCEPDLVARLKRGQKKSKCICCNKCLTYYKKPTKCYKSDGI